MSNYATSRDDLHAQIVATLIEQDYGTDYQPSPNGMAWAIVNAIWRKK